MPSIVIIVQGDGAATVAGDIEIMIVAMNNIGITEATFGVDEVWVGKGTSSPYTLN